MFHSERTSNIVSSEPKMRRFWKSFYKVTGINIAWITITKYVQERSYIYKNAGCDGIGINFPWITITILKTSSAKQSQAQYSFKCS